METNTALHLFRMIQEMITNTIKHGRASLCAIRVSEEPQQLVVQVRDDGVGFNFQKLARSSLGFGLQNILSRAEILHARIFIDAKPAAGVCYTVELPKSTPHETIN
jgi:signal transduction histidine kinase